MKPMFCRLLLVLTAAAAATSSVRAHTWEISDDPAERASLREHLLEEWRAQDQLRQAARRVPEKVRPTPIVSSGAAGTHFALTALAAASAAPLQARPFQAFSNLDLRWDPDFLYIGSNGIPAHNMMVGITAWQQQVPLPQDYRGNNAWRLPLRPVPATQPAMIKDRFMRGAIAIAVNGIPIFNPQNNRGEISYEIGELDQWGGHCGRADDYHYHITPLHLQTLAGKGMPVAYALDGYPIYGLTEPDGSPTSKLDECHGHDIPGIGYHYHGSMKAPYVIGGFHGVVTEREGQVDPQPRAQPVREASPPLRGAAITGFESHGPDGYKLTYTLGGETRAILYQIKADGTFPFQYIDGQGEVVHETYTRRGGGGRRPREEAASAMPGKEQNPPEPKAILTRDSPPDTDRDGMISAAEFAQAAKQDFSLNPEGRSLAEVMEAARAKFYALDKNGDGRLDTAERQSTERTPAMPSNEDRPSTTRMEQAPPRRGGGPPGGSPGEDPNRKPWLQVHGAEIDADGDGILTQEEIHAEAHRTFTGYDANQDGKISVEERNGPGTRTPMGGFVKQHPDKIDQNGDGLLTEAELAGQVLHMLGKMDQNDDGRLTADEWQSATGKAPPPQAGRSRQ